LTNKGSLYKKKKFQMEFFINIILPIALIILPIALIILPIALIILPIALIILPIALWPWSRLSL